MLGSWKKAHGGRAGELAIAILIITEQQHKGPPLTVDPIADPFYSSGHQGLEAQTFAQGGNTALAMQPGRSQPGQELWTVC